MTCLHLAVKFQESGGKLSIYTLMDMSRGFCAMDDFEEAELDILVDALEWRLSSDEISVAICNGIICLELLEVEVADAYEVRFTTGRIAFVL